MNRRRNTLVALLLIAIVALSVGYAALSQIITLTPKASVGDSKWEVRITNISENTMSKASTVETPTINVTTASFEVNLDEPGAKAIYDVTVSNNGTINAVLDSITGIEEVNSQEPTDIQFSVTDITEDEKLAASNSKTFQVTVEWISSSTVVPAESKTATISLNYIQDVN